jgi:hypothetical protein
MTARSFLLGTVSHSAMCSVQLANQIRVVRVLRNGARQTIRRCRWDG